MDTPCANPECDEIIYRSTLDKDLGWYVTDGSTYGTGGSRGKYAHSQECAEKLANNDELWQLALDFKRKRITMDDIMSA